MITVKEAKILLKGAENISVSYEGDEIDITLKSPASEALNNYVVEEIASGKPREYMLYLKHEYIKINS